MRQGVCHRDLKLENTLLDGSEAPRLKICDFGYSKVCNARNSRRQLNMCNSRSEGLLTWAALVQHAAFDSHPKSIVGTRAYIAPEIILSRFNKSQYNGEVRWQFCCLLPCGVTASQLYDRVQQHDTSGVQSAFWPGAAACSCARSSAARQQVCARTGCGCVERGCDAVPHAGRLVSLRGPPRPSKLEQNHPGVARHMAPHLNCSYCHVRIAPCSQADQAGSCRPCARLSRLRDSSCYRIAGAVPACLLASGLSRFTVSSRCSRVCPPCSQRICCAQYDIPPVLRLSAECVDLLSRILVAAPAQRIGVAGICAHPWFLRNLPGDLQVSRPKPTLTLTQPLIAAGRDHASRAQAEDASGSHPSCVSPSAACHRHRVTATDATLRPSRQTALPSSVKQLLSAESGSRECGRCNAPHSERSCDGTVLGRTEAWRRVLRCRKAASRRRSCRASWRRPALRRRTPRCGRTGTQQKTTAGWQRAEANSVHTASHMGS